MEGNFTFVEPLTTKPKKRQYLIGEDWEPHKSLILKLVYDKKMKLPEVVKYMVEQEGFLAKERQYAYALEAWGNRRRNICLSSAQIAHLLNQVEERRTVGKDSAFRYSEKRGGEKISFRRMLDYLRKKTPQMQSASFEERLKVASKLSLGLSSEGVVVYTPTGSTISNSGARNPTSRSEISLGLTTEDTPESRSSSPAPSTPEDVLPHISLGEVFPLDRSALEQIQEIDGFLGPYSRSLPTAVVMDLDEVPPLLHICSMPYTLLNAYTQEEPHSPPPHNPNPTPSNLFAAYVHIDDKTSSTEIIDSVNEIYAEMVNGSTPQGWPAIDMRNSVSAKVENRLAMTVANSTTARNLAAKSAVRQKELIDRLSKAGLRAPETEVPIRRDAPWEDLHERVRNKKGKEVGRPEENVESLNEASWMYFFRQKWEECLRVSKIIDDYKYDPVRSDNRMRLTMKIFNCLRVSSCFEALGEYKSAFESVHSAADWATRLFPVDREPYLALIRTHEKLLRMHILFRLYGFEAADQHGVYPVLDEIRTLYTVDGAGHIPTRAILYRLQMLGLGWGDLGSLHNAMQENSPFTRQPSHLDDASYINHPVFCMPMRENLCWLLTKQSDPAMPFEYAIFSDGGKLRCAELIKNFIKTARSPEQLDMHMIGILQLTGPHLNESALPLLLQAKDILKRWLFCMQPHRSAFSRVEGIGRDIDYLEKVAKILNIKGFSWQS